MPNNRSAIRRWLLRSLIIAGGLVAWFWTQRLIAARPFPADGMIQDRVHQLTASLHGYFLENPSAADLLLISSSFVIDCVGLWLLLSSIFGSTMRPFMELLVVFFLRQASQGLTALPAPAGMIWRDPGVPSLLVTYGTSTDLFFSGHTAIAVLGAIELSRLGRPWSRALGWFVALFEISTVLILRAHYFMDVFTGILAALLVAYWFRNWKASPRSGSAEMGVAI